jgi:hypothetical protein
MFGTTNPERGIAGAPLGSVLGASERVEDGCGTRYQQTPFQYRWPVYS